MLKPGKNINTAWIITLMLLSGCAREQAGEEQGLFRQLPPSASGLNFNNQLSPDENFNIIEYLYYYNGGGVAVGDVNNDGLPDLYFSANQQSNALFLNRGGLRFEDVTEPAGVGGAPGWSTGVTMVDINGDGWLDIYACRLGDYKGIEGHNELFINNQDGTFREAAADYGLAFRGFSTQAAFFDYDRDGDLDCYLLNHSVHSTENYGPSEIRNRRDALAGDRLLRNEDGIFRDVTAQAGIYSSRIGYGLGVAVGDLNDDGCPDIYVSNDFHENDYLYYNNCDGTFREAVRSSLSYTSTFSMGSDIADFDNDGRLDLITLDMKPADPVVLKRSVGPDPYAIYNFKLGFGYYYQYPRNMLQWNRGNLLGNEATFSEVGHLAGIDATDWSWAPLFCDLDGDGRKDLFITNGIWQRPNDLDYLKFSSNRQLQAEASDTELAALMPPGKVPNYAFRNEGDLTFTDVTREWGLALTGCSNGAAYADLDRDGDLDLVVNNLNQEAAIFENRRAREGDYHFLRLRLEGPAGNSFGVGARIEVEAGGQKQVQELYPTRGFQSAVEPVLTFGLGAAGTIDHLSIRWPDGRISELTGLPADRELTVAIDSGVTPAPAKPASPPLLTLLPDGAGLDFTHRENQAVDFDREVLMPHMLSTQGPRIAVADLDGDGWEDLYICGARGQQGALYRQRPEGGFQRMKLPADPGKEEVDAAFFDADNDGDPDLYIVAGGGEAIPSSYYQDELWLNDGRGQFTLAPEALPPVDADGACVVPLDFNSDGAMDLFVGSRSVLGSYGLPPRSYLLQNDGSGRFSEVTERVAPALASVGMVTDACRIGGAETQQLVIVGEWMPVTIYSIGKAGWKKTTIPFSEGWWNTVQAADLDGDGDEDLLLGNLGLNTDLKASREEPVSLYIKDFDGNQKTDPVLTNYRQGREYPYAWLDELSKPLTFFRKRYNNYREFASDAFREVLPDDMLEGATILRAYTFASAIAFNQGAGNFSLQPLTREAQISPLYDFVVGDLDGDQISDVLAVGNFYENNTSLGRQDASLGHWLKGNGDGSFMVVPPGQSGFVVPGPARAVRLLMSPGGRLIVLARNNAPVVVYRLQEE